MRRDAMQYYQEKGREIPVIETDVFVAGAGTAGCIAAIAAARAGARVVLAEIMPVLGVPIQMGELVHPVFFQLPKMTGRQFVSLMGSLMNWRSGWKRKAVPLGSSIHRKMITAGDIALSAIMRCTKRSSARC